MNLLFHQNFCKKFCEKFCIVKKNYQLIKLNLRVRWIWMYSFRKDIST